MADSSSRPSPLMERLVEMYKTDYRKLVNRVSGRVGGITNAEDVVQDAFCNAIRYIDTVAEEDTIPQWFNTILNNSARSFKTQERFEGMSSEEEGTEELVESRIREDLLKDVIILMDKMSEPKRSVVKGYFILGRKPREIAKYSPMSPGAIRIAVHRFKGELTRRFGEDVCS